MHGEIKRFEMLLQNFNVRYFLFGHGIYG